MAARLTNSPAPNDPTCDVSQSEEVPSGREGVNESAVDIEGVVAVVGEEEGVGDAATDESETA